MVLLGGAIGASIGYTDGGFFTEGLGRLGGKVGDKINKSIEKGITDKNDNPTRIRYYGDPVSALDFKANSVVPDKNNVFLAF